MKIIYILIVFLLANSAYSEMIFEQNDIKKSSVLSDSKTSQICETDKKILNYKDKINKTTPNTGAPGITVDDYTFSPYPLSADGNNPTVLSTVLRIKNGCEEIEGTQPLVIIGYTEPTLKEYTHNLPVINEANPLILNPGEEFTFRVNFSPKNIGIFLDSIVFLTESDLGCDNVCVLNGKVISTWLMSQEYSWEKVRINYSKQPTNIYEPVGSDLITAINSSSKEFGSQLKINRIYIEGIKGPAETNNGLDGFSFEQSFTSTLPSNPMNYFRGVSISQGIKSTQRKVYFRPTTVGKYEINYYFQSNAEASGEETRYVIKGHGVVPNLYLYQDDNAIEITDVVDFGTIENNIPQESVTERLTLANYPTNMDDGDFLTINSIDWGARATTNISNLGEMNNEFYVNESKMFEDLGQSGYPITLGIGESVDVEVTYFTKNNDTEHRSDVTIESDADESGASGKFNNTITLLGNAKSSSVINKQTTSNFYPNPANNTITFDKSIKGNIEFYNLLGEKVLDFDANLKSTFDISNIQNGIYIIKYKIDNQFYSEKLSVSR